MTYIHDADLTCYAQTAAFSAGHSQIERYAFPFEGPPKKIKVSVAAAVREALEAREKRGVRGGRLHVELDTDVPGSGRVVDHVPRWTTPEGSDEKLEAEAGKKPAGK